MDPLLVLVDTMRTRVYDMIWVNYAGRKFVNTGMNDLRIYTGLIDRGGAELSKL